MTIFLEEPSTCSYTLTVEATFLCPLLESTNEIGLIQLSDTATLQTEPPVDAPPTDSPPTVDPHDPDEAIRSHRGHYESEHVQSHSGSNEPDSHSNPKSQPLQSHSSTHEPHSHSSSKNEHVQSHSSSTEPSEEAVSGQPASSSDFHSHSSNPHPPNQDLDYADSANKQPNQERRHDKLNEFPRDPPVPPKPPVKDEERRSGYRVGKDLTNPQARDEKFEADKSGSVLPRRRNEQKEVVHNSFGDDDTDFEDGERSKRKSTRDRKDSTSHA